MPATFLFYDIETTGLNKAFDQILEFAAIRTDAALDEIGREHLTIRLRADVIPQPEALLTHRIAISRSLSGIPEYEAMCRIHRLFNTPETITIGYNSLGFDDEFIRFGFYRNLLSPYRHQYDNGCFRMDLFPIAIIYFLFHPQGVTWPETGGKPSLKLEALSDANALVPGRAHEAMTDVAATLALARRFRRAPAVWDYLVGYFEKAKDRERVENLPVFMRSPMGPHRLGLLVDGRFGTDRRYMAPALSIGTSIPYTNQELWFRLDAPSLSEAGPETLPDLTWVVRKKYGEPPLVLPPKDRYQERIPDDVKALTVKGLQWIEKNPGLFEAAVGYHRNYRYPEVPDVDLDAALYLNGFMPASEERRCQRFHKAGIEEKVAMLDAFEHPQIRELAFRLLWRNYPDAAPDAVRRYMDGYRRRVNPASSEKAMVDFRGERRTIPADALAGIHRLREEQGLDAGQKALLGELESYLTERFGG